MSAASSATSASTESEASSSSEGTSRSSSREQVSYRQLKYACAENQHMKRSILSRLRTLKHAGVQVEVRPPFEHTVSQDGLASLARHSESTERTNV
jgi:hypothetical protein